MCSSLDARSGSGCDDLGGRAFPDESDEHDRHRGQADPDEEPGGVRRERNRRPTGDRDASERGLLAFDDVNLDFERDRLPEHGNSLSR